MALPQISPVLLSAGAAEKAIDGTAAYLNQK
jgi:hypothetical protein